MYCSECKLRVADDSVEVCPVCQGPLQSETKNESVYLDGVPAGKVEAETPEIKVGDKFIAYEKIDEDFDFNPENLGLQALEKDSEAESDDMKVLAKMWQDEDIDADLEGVFAEAFTLDEVGETGGMEDELDLLDNDDVDVDLEGVLAEALIIDDEDQKVGMKEELNLGKNDLGPVKPESFPDAPVSVVSGPRKNNSLWLFLLLVALGAGGASWFYFQSLAEKPSVDVVKPPSQVESVKATPEIVPPKPVAEKVEVVEPGDSAAPSSVKEVSSKLKVEAPVSVAKSDEIVNVKAQEVVKSSKPTAVVGAQSVAQSLNVSGPEQKVTASVGKSETLIPVAERVKEKISDSAKNANQKNSVKADKRKKTGLSTAALVRHEGAAAGVAVVSKTVPADSPGDAGVSLKSSYVVHVGSFKSEKRASRQLARLQKKGFSAYIAVVDLKGKGVWQRVMVSGGATREDAKAVQAKIAEVFPKEDSLVRKVTK